MPTDVVVRPQAVPREVSATLPGVQLPEPFTLVIFGVTGDLAARKLLPALHGLWQRRCLPRQFAIVGVGRRPNTDDGFRSGVQTNLAAFGRPAAAADRDEGDFLGHTFYHQADFLTADGIRSLGRRLHALEEEQRLPGNRLFYLATDPLAFAPIVAELAATGLVQRHVGRPWGRVVIEKPYGHDLASALQLDQRVRRHLHQEQVYRIDHYLGKETVQNLLAFRFANAVFEPLFTRQYVEHVQITVAETIGMEGRRGAYYDHAGALRDMVQNHLLQLLALIAMDPPATLSAGDISDAKLKVLRTLMPFSGSEVERRVVRGQYQAGTVSGQPVRSYREEEAVPGDSLTETYVALRAQLESWRWAGVPFLLRTGKRLARQVTEIAVQFKLPPLRLFQTVACEGDLCGLSDAQPAVLAFRIQPEEGISLTFSAKRPGMRLDVEPVRFEFDYDRSFHQVLPTAYERLLLDALRGDATLFARSDELDAAWQFVMPILESWSDGPKPVFPNYAAGTWGPAVADGLAADCLGGWRRP
jgi:glucose-6-phosphate 1-dehydrogenase